MKFSRIIIGVALLAVGTVGYIQRSEIRDFIEELKKPTLPAETTVQQTSTSNPIYVVTQTEKSTTSKADSADETNVAIKPEVNLGVPFTSQAPLTNWDYPFQEACEEASAIMAHAYFKGVLLDQYKATDAIQKLVAWQIQRFGYYEDTTALQVQEILNSYFGLTNTHLEHLTSKENFFSTIQTELSQGNLILVPAAGRLLHNPNFKAPGPVYHMLVIKGYTKDGMIITNDPGTRKGHNYLYDVSTLYNAVHDWNAVDIQSGAKVIIVVRK